MLNCRVVVLVALTLALTACPDNSQKLLPPSIPPGVPPGGPPDGLKSLSAMMGTVNVSGVTCYANSVHKLLMVHPEMARMYPKGKKASPKESSFRSLLKIL